jgi:hypothetical protein
MALKKEPMCEYISMGHCDEVRESQVFEIFNRLPNSRLVEFEGKKVAAWENSFAD